MHSSIMIAMKNLGVTLAIDYVEDNGIVTTPEASRALLDDDLGLFMEVMGFTVHRKLVHHIEVVPPGPVLTDDELALLEAIAPALLAGSFVIWQDGEGAPFKAVVVEQGRLVRLTEEHQDEEATGGGERP